MTMASVSRLKDGVSRVRKRPRMSTSPAARFKVRRTTSMQ
jgi:hypothetical protein